MKLASTPPTDAWQRNVRSEVKHIGIYLMVVIETFANTMESAKVPVTRPKLAESLWPGQSIPEATNILISFLCFA